MSEKRKRQGGGDKELKKPRFFNVDDGLGGYNIARSASPCLIFKYLEDGGGLKIGSLIPARGFTQPFVTFDPSEHISSLMLHMVFDHEENSGEICRYTATIRLSAYAVGGMTIRALSDIEINQLDLKQYHDKGSVFYFLKVGPINSNFITAERLFCDSPDAQHFNFVANLFRNMDAMHLIIKGTENLPGDYQALEAQFANEHKEDKIMAWHKNHPGKVMAQVGMFLKKSERPTLSHYKPTTSFHTWPEYMTVMAFSLLQEEEAKNAKVRKLEDNTFDLRVVTLPKSADRRYLACLFLTPGTSVRLSSGDRLKINFDPEIDAREEDWTAVIVDTVSWAPLNSVSLLITRPFDTDEHGRGSWRDGTPFQIADFNEMRDDRQARQALAKTPCIKVTVKSITSDQVFGHCLTGLQKIDAKGTPDLKKWFLASRMDEFPTVDFFASLRDKFGDSIEEDILDLSGGQQEAARGLKALRGGKQFCQGSPGTGKTRYIKEIVKPFLMDDSQVHQGIITSTTNEGVVQLALDMQALAEKVRPKGKPTPMIIWFHSISTEEDIGFLDAKKARGKPEDARPSLVDDTLDVETLQECVSLNDRFEQILRSSKYPEPLINDPRLKQLQLSLGVRMLQVAGMTGFECEYSEPEKFVVVRDMYHKYKNNWNWLPEHMQDLKEAMKELRAYTLSPNKKNVKVTIIACTVANVATPALYTNATKVEFFLLDDVARITEPELWPVFAHYPATPCHVLVGDPRQLQTQLESRRNNNCFAPQLEVSLFSRFCNGGHIYSFFDEQHRAVQPIGDLVSAIFYNKKVTNAENCGLDHPSRDIARRIMTFNKDLYNKHSTIIFLDNKDSVAEQNDVHKSTYNLSNCAVGINLAVNLVKNNFDASAITILTPYAAQRHYYQSAIERAHAMHPDQGIRNIKIAVIDAYQGQENHIIILDWTVGRDLGFLKDFGRLCVAHSRARDALYVIGNKAELEKNKKSDLRVFKKLLGPDGLAWRWFMKGKQTSPYVSA